MFNDLVCQTVEAIFRGSQVVKCHLVKNAFREEEIIKAQNLFKLQPRPHPLKCNLVPIDTIAIHPILIQ